LDSEDFREFNDHRYFKQPLLGNDMSNHFIDSFTPTYFVGYVVIQARKFSVAKSCEVCFIPLYKYDDFEHHDRFTLERSQGHLFIPSDILLNLVYIYEQSIVKMFERNNFQTFILFDGKHFLNYYCWSYFNYFHSIKN